MPTWNAGQYLRFADERTRPCRGAEIPLTVQPILSPIIQR